jgi:hypothetical protein
MNQMISLEDMALTGRGRGLSETEGSAIRGVVVVCVLGSASLLLLLGIQAWDHFNKKVQINKNKSSITPSSLSLIKDKNVLVTFRKQKVESSLTNYVDLATPSFFLLDGKTFFQKFKNELKRYHHYLGCFNQKSSQNSRIFHVLSLVVSVYVIVFVQMLLYDFIHPVTSGVVHERRLPRVFLMAILGGVVSTVITIWTSHWIVTILGAESVSGASVQDGDYWEADGATHGANEVLEYTVGEEVGYLLHDLQLYRSDLSLEKRKKFNGNASALYVNNLCMYVIQSIIVI